MNKKLFSVLLVLVLVLSFSLVTAVPVFAKGPAGKGNRPELETVTVYADGTEATSTTTLVNDLRYRFEVSGTFSAGANITADAEYSSGPDTFEWQDLVEKYESSGEGLLELKVDGEFVEWGEYNDDHTYSLYYFGTGNTVSFQIDDIYYPNNSGLLTVKIFAVVGYDEFGYNYQARLFVGSADGVDRNLDGLYAGASTYANDHLVMKWSKGWDDARFNEGDWGPGAWETNEWNGMVPGGSGEVWHFKIIWVGTDLEDSPYWREGGYPLWNQFEVIMSHGVEGGEHIWDTLANPCGFGGS